MEFLIVNMMYLLDFNSTLFSVGVWTKYQKCFFFFQLLVNY
ncbi:hypothetical protein NC653_040384 [Populus alba x Populus x berolinensis]|uniref:Uncharacterized protein n=1 Tax=Populus alba x Populus x berolinensis TaxID=444605 RepID=A0AAD6LE40_9ROSI|nr:hypothetical protein NC653_040384 [Populus alba x Populus x berolinensis]